MISDTFQQFLSIISKMLDPQAIIFLKKKPLFFIIIKNYITQHS